ncbi:MAG: SGNH/GDSL hydrolase family protein [Deltaproteobacteria bacterium]
MRRLVLAIPLFIAACSSNKDPFAGGDAGSGSSGGDAGHVADGGLFDAAPTHSCVAAPKRIVILGDSITACSVIGGPMAADCVSKQFSDYVIAHYGPGATYENHAVGGAVINDIAGQLAGVPATPGPTLVMLFIGGNDLTPYLNKSDAAAMTGWTGTVEPMMQAMYDATFTALADTSKFPGGATLLMNTQYNPFDDCSAAPYMISASKTEILHEFNDKIKTIAGAHGASAIVVDTHSPFLGHGLNYQATTCPHYIANTTSYMQDLIHANAAGNAVLAGVDNGGADRLYRDCNP